MNEEQCLRCTGELKKMFEKEFGEFRLEDFEQVVATVREQFLKEQQQALQSYERLTDQERDQIEFMMGL